MDGGLWPQNSTFSSAGVVLTSALQLGSCPSSFAMALLEKAFPPTYLYSLKISPLPVKTWVCHLGLRPSVITDLNCSRGNKTKQRGVCTLLLPAFHLQAPGETSSRARSRGGGWRTSEQQNPQHCSRTQPCSLHSEEQLWDTRLSCNISWDTVGRLRFMQMGQRHQPEEFCGSGNSNFQEMG